MALNPQYEAIGKGFVQQYYALFDDPTQRANLANMYNVESSFMTFEGTQLQGSVKIMEKLNSLRFQKINRIITDVDSQPMFDGGVLINVLGRLQTDEDPPHAFSQVLGIHDTA
ncbi:Nuclear transport factor 2 (NTF2) domain [Popillia japonica]|uniref:Nuclear transport factor 2 (NTF2) domain n=1 Tax=Popillia japonica TaxID=7064 RepID=A0AAW1MJA6_POPJA